MGCLCAARCAGRVHGPQRGHPELSTIKRRCLFARHLLSLTEGRVVAVPPFRLTRHAMRLPLVLVLSSAPPKSAARGHAAVGGGVLSNSAGEGGSRGVDSSKACCRLFVLSDRLFVL